MSLKLEEGGATAEATEVDNETLNQLNAAFLASVVKAVPEIKTDPECLDFNYQLIQEVKRRPCLYNMNDDTYNNNQMRAAMWIEIAQKFNTSSEFVKTRWKTMRDRYKKEEKRWKAGKHTSWSFFPQLHFISPYLRARYPHDPVDCQQSDEEGSPQPTITLETLLATAKASEEVRVEASSRKRQRPADDKEELARVEPSVPSPLSINTASSPLGLLGGQSTPISLGSTASSSHPMLNPRVDQIQRDCGIPQLAPPVWNRLQDEEAEIFGHMIAMKISKLPPKLKEKAKIRLWTVLFDIEFGSENGGGSNC
ncbi:unnamed protein product, partial [Mesorhabditis belari]|uniref:MADF domain-containing protein n=1 Tax=Mesorhabditis belari TaxID=2138241 RepID=A0AAF3F0N4_9BILA